MVAGGITSTMDHGSIVAGAELAYGIIFGALALGCLVNWLKDWRHDSQGRVFFTLLTAVALLLALAILGDTVRRQIGAA